ncbi:MAG TPA: hypothetical protein VFV05_23890 [Methylomirabilota bacterium]|nr:hypothetical protein [Methylomirabilota bacterium]
MRWIAECCGRQPLEPPDEICAHPRHPAEHGGQGQRAAAGDRARVEAVGVGHALEPTDAVAAAAGDEAEPAHGFLVAGQQVRQDVLDGPPVLRAGSNDFALGQSGDEHQRGGA